MAETFLDDVAIPGSGTVFYYLNRTSFPHFGSWGYGDQGIERTFPCR